MKQPCTINSPADVYETFHPKLARQKMEFFLVALLNNKNEIVKKAVVGIGSTSECRVEPIQVFHFACKNAAQRIILIHNHPSGDTAPSSADVSLTQRLKNGGDILGITILDHVIVSKKGYASMRDMGLI